ncbi:MAG: CBS domain-containing protein [Acidimicrobiales bacterium]
MSPRAACRLERFGFERVYDYVLGIADWKGAGLPVVGEAPRTQTVADASRPDVPTCAPGERLEEARIRTFDADWDECIVIDCGGVVVGRLRPPVWEGDPDAPVESVMEPGPTTVRPDFDLHPLVERMQKRGTKLVVVATPQGGLVGVLLREDAERLLTGEAPEQIWQECEGCPGQWKLQGPSTG